MRKTLHTGMDLLTDKQRTRLEGVFAQDRHAQVEASWSVYQKIVGAYRNPDRAAGRDQLAHLIDAISREVPSVLAEITTLGRTLKLANILAVPLLLTLGVLALWLWRRRKAA